MHDHKNLLIDKMIENDDLDGLLEINYQIKFSENDKDVDYEEFHDICRESSFLHDICEVKAKKIFKYYIENNGVKDVINFSGQKFYPLKFVLMTKDFDFIKFVLNFGFDYNYPVITNFSSIEANPIKDNLKYFFECITKPKEIKLFHYVNEYVELIKYLKK